MGVYTAPRESTVTMSLSLQLGGQSQNWRSQCKREGRAAGPWGPQQSWKTQTPVPGCAHPHSIICGTLTDAVLDVIAVSDFLVFPRAALAIKLSALADPYACLLAYDFLTADGAQVRAGASTPVTPGLPLSVHCRDRGHQDADHSGEPVRGFREEMKTGGSE